MFGLQKRLMRGDQGDNLSAQTTQIVRIIRSVRSAAEPAAVVGAFRHAGITTTAAVDGKQRILLAQVNRSLATHIRPELLTMLRACYPNWTAADGGYAAANSAAVIALTPAAPIVVELGSPGKNGDDEDGTLATTVVPHALSDSPHSADAPPAAKRPATSPAPAPPISAVVQAPHADPPSHRGPGRPPSKKTSAVPKRKKIPSSEPLTRQRQPK